MSTLDPEAAPPWLRPLLDALLDVDRTDLLPHHLEAPPTDARRAAILMLFGETPAHGPDVLLAERASTLRSHAGQVAFPGGGTECGDSGAIATALREAEEETGLDPSGVVPLAVLPELYLPPSGFAVTPVLAHWARPSRSTPSTRRDRRGRARPARGAGRSANRLRIQHPSPATSEPPSSSRGCSCGASRRAYCPRCWIAVAGRAPGTRPGSSTWKRRGAPPGRTVRSRGAMSWVDLVVIALALLAAISGWRHGMAVALLSFVGVLGGAIIGVRVAPCWPPGISNTNTRVIVSVAVVVMLVVLGETTGVFLGRRVRDRITGERFLGVDSTLGSVLQALAVVVAAWLVALPLATASLPGIAAGVRGSQVLSAVDSVMPTAAKQLPAELRQLLDNSGFPDVLSPFARNPVTATGPPNSALTRSPAVAAAQPASSRSGARRRRANGSWRGRASSSPPSW